MSTTCVYSDIVLPTATWYEKNDLNTSDMHPFIHPLTRGGRSGLGIAHRLGHLQGHCQAFSESAPEVLGVETRRRADADACTTRRANWRSPSACRTGSATGRRRCRAGPCRGGGGRARLPDALRRVHLPRPAAGEARQRRQGHRLEDRARGRLPGPLNGTCGRRGQGRPRIDTDIDAVEAILSLAPETNGEVAVKAWEALAKQTGREHPHLARRSGTRRSASAISVAQPRKIISSPTWSGLESERSATTPATPTSTN